MRTCVRFVLPLLGVVLTGCGSDAFQEPIPGKATLTVVLGGGGTGSVKSADGKVACASNTSTSCKVTYEFPATGSAPVVLTATADPTARFVGFAAPCSTDANCKLDLATDTTVVANFEPKVGLTIDYQLDADAASTVTSVPPGVNLTASGKTTAYFDPGAEVVLTVNAPQSGPETFRFSGACTGTNGGPNGSTCKVKLDTAKSVTVRAAHYNYAFLTSSKHTGALGGLAGADTVCNSLATAAGLPGNFVAFLSTESVDATSRISTANGWRRTDGVGFIYDKAYSFGVGGSVKAALDVDETGKHPAAYDNAFERILTGSLDTGAKLNYSNHDHCGNWTGVTGQVSHGAAPLSGRLWLAAGAGACSANLRFVCLGTDLDRKLPTAVAPANARRAFVSATSVLANQGIAAFDQVCKTEATAASLPNANKFNALVAPSNGVSAASRFDLTKGPWVGTDGVLLAPDAKSLMEAYPWIAGVHHLATGTVVASPPVVLTGYRNTTTLVSARPTDPGNFTCAGWTSNAGGTLLGFGQGGFTGSYAMSFADSNTTDCAFAQGKVYCLEN